MRYVVVLIAIGVLSVAGIWFRQHPSPQPEWECHSYPGYCDIDQDWRPPVTK